MFVFYSFSFYRFTSSLVSRVSVNALSPFFSYFDLYRHFILTLLSPSLFPFLSHFLTHYIFPFSTFLTFSINLYFFFPVFLLLLSFSQYLPTFSLYISRSLYPLFLSHSCCGGDFCDLRKTNVWVIDEGARSVKTHW